MSRRDGFKLEIPLASCVLALAPLATAVAAESDTDSSPVKLEEIVVTAQKRSEGIQEVPGSVSVVSGVQLDKMHVTQLADLGAYVPGLQVDNFGTPGQTQLTIRGIPPLSSNATVGTYIDDTPIGATGFHERGGSYAVDLLPYDVKQIEVLAGPQGTLYGANALGGILKYDLVQPNLNGTDIRAGVDVEGVRSAASPGGGARFFINSAVVPGQLGVIFSYSQEKTPGYIDNAATGQKDQNGDLQQAARVALRWAASDDLTIGVNSLYQRTNASGDATVALSPQTMQPLYGDRTDYNERPNTYYSVLRYAAVDVKWHLPWADFVSASSWNEKTDNYTQDATATYQPLIPLLGGPSNAGVDFPLELTSKKFTQELRLSSVTGVQTEWLIGAYFDDEHATNFQYLNVYDASGASLASAGLSPLLAASLPSTYREYAGFGNVTQHFGQAFDVAAGVRYAKNDQAFTEIIEPGSPIVPAAVVPGTSSEGVWTWSVKPRFHITDTTMAYGVVSTGYQAGGPNTALPGAPRQVNSSTLTNYELGLKSSQWNQRATIDLSVFQLNWHKIQLPATLPDGISYVANGGTARSRGAELDASAQVTAHFLVHGSVTYTDARLTSNAISIGGYDGNPLPFVPKTAASLTLDYTDHAFGMWDYDGGLGVRAEGARYSVGPFALDELRTAGYGALDANFALTSAHYSIRLYGKNVLDKRAYLTAFSFPNLDDTAIAQNEGIVIPPRTIGLSLETKF
jgi:iron complex outermembrane recepter protein